MPDTVVLTGSSGYAGRVLAAAILTRGTERLVLPIRSGRSAAEVAEAILEEAQACAPDRPVASYADRLDLVPFEGLRDRLARSPVREIIHCAGCVDYFDKDKLTAGNLVLTHDMLKLGRALGVGRFVYLSTAFSAGDRNGALIKEELHTDDDGADLTDYMASKRQA
ncbi:MAG: NAD-dependent epimerase/dehydratase family protein, partial [Pseudomonadota bacterium]